MSAEGGSGGRGGRTRNAWFLVAIIVFSGCGGDPPLTPRTSPSPGTSSGATGGRASLTPSPWPRPTVTVTEAPTVESGSTTYTVVAGDTLARIARKCRVSLDALIAANPALENPDKLSIGQVLAIPAASYALLLEARPDGGSLSPFDVRLALGRTVTIRVDGAGQFAGEMASVEELRPPSTGWTEHTSVEVGYEIDLDVFQFGGSVDRPMTLSYRASLPATTSHPSVQSNILTIAWGGPGPCPARYGEGPVTRSFTALDGTRYEVVPDVDPDFNSRWSLLATPRGSSTTRAQDFEVCRIPQSVLAGSDGTAYVLLVAADSGGRLELSTAGPEGIRSTRPVPADTQLLLDPRGVVHALSYEIAATGDATTTLTALDRNGGPRPGWPYVAHGLASAPFFTATGTAYLAESQSGNDRVVAIGPDGRMKPGWPYSVPGELVSISRGTWGFAPRQPSVTSDAVFDAFEEGVYVIAPDGASKPGWPYLLPAGTSVAPMASRCDIPGEGPFRVAMTWTGRMYLPRLDQRSSDRHEDFLCFNGDGTFCPGWPVRLPDGVAVDQFHFDTSETTVARLSGGEMCATDTTIGIRTDGSMFHAIARGDTLSGIADLLDLTLAALIAANPGITDPSLIHAGQLVEIPRPGASP